jgi:hypothetical protein
MPKTAINEDAELVWTKDKIGLANKLLPSPPTGDPCCSKDRNQLQLVGSVATLCNAAHYLRSFAWCPDVSHESSRRQIETKRYVAVFASSENFCNLSENLHC